MARTTSSALEPETKRERETRIIALAGARNDTKPPVSARSTGVGITGERAPRVAWALAVGHSAASTTPRAGAHQRRGSRLRRPIDRLASVERQRLQCGR